MFDKRYHKAMARLRFRQLQLVSVLGRTHNLNAAAKQLVMTQPAATKMLREIEDIVGSPLFERLPRGMRPTEIGQVATLYAHRAIDEAVKFLDDSRVLREGGQGTLQIGAIMAAVEHLLPAALAEMHELRPKLTVRLLTGTSDQLVIALLQNRVELVLGRPSEMTSYATAFTPLLDEEVWAFASADHPLAGVKGLTPADVVDERAHLVRTGREPTEKILPVSIGVAECFADIKLRVVVGVVVDGNARPRELARVAFAVDIGIFDPEMEPLISWRDSRTSMETRDEPQTKCMHSPQ